MWNGYLEVSERSGSSPGKKASQANDKGRGGELMTLLLRWIFRKMKDKPVMESARVFWFGDGLDVRAGLVPEAGFEPAPPEGTTSSR